MLADTEDSWIEFTIEQLYLSDKKLFQSSGLFVLQINGVDVRSVPQDAAVQLVQRSVDKVTLLVEKDAEQQFKNSEFYSLVRNSRF